VSQLADLHRYRWGGISHIHLEFHLRGVIPVVISWDVFCQSF
jgi:hypothetical protein